MEIAPHLHQIELRLGDTNAFLLGHQDDLVLIDAGLPWNGKRILKYIQDSGYSPGDLTAILITHADIDHLGSLVTLKKQTQAKVFLHSADLPFLEGGAVPGGLAGRVRRLSLLLLRGVKVDGAIKDGANLPGGLRAIHSPGHTPGSTCYFLPQRRIIFLGDVLRNASRPSLPPSLFNIDQAQIVESVKRVAQLDFEIACFGHGHSLVGNASKKIREYAERL